MTPDEALLRLAERGFAAALASDGATKIIAGTKRVKVAENEVYVYEQPYFLKAVGEGWNVSTQGDNGMMQYEKFSSLQEAVGYLCKLGPRKAI